METHASIFALCLNTAQNLTLNTFFLTSLSHSVMFVLPISTTKRHMITRPVSAGFPCLNVSYALNSDAPFSRIIKLRAMYIAATCHVAIQKFTSVIIRTRAATWLAEVGLVAAFLFLNLKKPSLCKPTLCSPNLRACTSTPRRRLTKSAPPIFSRFILTVFRTNGLSVVSTMFPQFWTSMVLRGLRTNCVIPSTTFLSEVLP